MVYCTSSCSLSFCRKTSPSEPLEKKLHQKQNLSSCFADIVKLPQYVNMWVNADVWVDLIHQRFEIPINLEFKAADLNRVLSRNYPYKAYDLECTTTPNDIGVYKATKKAGISGNDNTTAYLSTTPKTLPLQPGGNSKWHHSCESLSGSKRQHEELDNVPVLGIHEFFLSSFVLILWSTFREVDVSPIGLSGFHVHIMVLVCEYDFELSIVRDFVPSHLIVGRHGLPYASGQGRTSREVTFLSIVGLRHVDAHGTEIIVKEIIVFRVVFVFPGIIVFRHVDLT